MAMRPEEAEPDEDSITTEDHQTWFQYGKVYHQGDANSLRRKMDKDQFWPDVFWISDHGNAHLILDFGEKAGQGKRPARARKERIVAMDRGSEDRPEERLQGQSSAWVRNVRGGYQIFARRYGTLTVKGPKAPAADALQRGDDVEVETFTGSALFIWLNGDVLVISPLRKEQIVSNLLSKGDAIRALMDERQTNFDAAESLYDAGVRPRGGR